MPQPRPKIAKTVDSRFSLNPGSLQCPPTRGPEDRCGIYFKAFHKGETNVNMKTILKTSVAAAALMALSAPAMATIENGQPKVKLKVYGHVSKAGCGATTARPRAP